MTDKEFDKINTLAHNARRDLQKARRLTNLSNTPHELERLSLLMNRVEDHLVDYIIGLCLVQDKD